MSKPLTVFISYAREDEVYKERLTKHLRTLQIEELIKGWDDRMITAGRDWEGDLRFALDTADIILLLVSADFTNSAYCVSVEASKAVERWKANKARVIPVILRAVEWRTLPLGQGEYSTKLGLLQALPKDALPVKQWPDEDQAFENIAAGLRAVIYEMGQQRAESVGVVAPVGGAGGGGARGSVAEQARGTPLSPERDAVQVAVGRLAPFIESDAVTWFLGSRSSPAAPDSLLRECRIACSLLADLQLVDHQWDRLLPPVDVAASYYGVKKGLTTLVHDVTEWISRDSAQVLELHQRLATLLAVARRRLGKFENEKPQLRPPRRHQQLIVTTNIDLMMERALVATGMPFTRIVQFHSEPRLEIGEYQGGAAGSTDIGVLDALFGSASNRTVTLDDSNSSQTTNQNPLESLSLREMPQPILYKLRGSLDLPESCTISTEQYLDFCLNMAPHFVPSQIRAIVQGTPGVFLGFGYLDPDFRLVYYTFFRALTELRKEDRQLYSVQLPPTNEMNDNYRRMEIPIWEDLKDSGPRRAKITTVEQTCEDFLRRLLLRIAPTDPLVTNILGIPTESS